MDIKILDSWLREYLDTKATPLEIAKYLSLAGPSVERIKKIEDDFIYEIEITTNRIDEVGVYGIAREASAILPRFGIPAKLKILKSESKNYVFKGKVNYLEAKVNPDLCPRFTAVLVKNVKIAESSKLIKKRLVASDVRPINNIVDISNYITLEIGQPVHTFDYDKIKGSNPDSIGAKMVLRESKKGEKLQTLDGKEFILPGGDIVIEDGEGKLIDLAGIMGGETSAITENTKNVLLFVQTYNPVKIRKTSMFLAQRTMAATIFEKGTDPELVNPAILKGIQLFKSECGGSVEKDILNIYPNPYKVKEVKVTLNFLEKRLGINIAKSDITKYLSSLQFDSAWSGDTLTLKVPSFRAKDINLPEDILEEVARIYGYHNLPSTIMDGQIPVRQRETKFGFEMKTKEIISGFGGVEIYTLSLVPQNFAGEKSLKLKNPLGSETEHLRTTLRHSLLSAADSNLGLSQKFHLFEIANVYIPKINDLPEEKLMLAGILFNYDYRQTKGIIEAILQRLHISVSFKPEEEQGFAGGKYANIYFKNDCIGAIGVTDERGYIYYEFRMEKIKELAPTIVSFSEIPKYPAQIEDVTFNFLKNTKAGEVAEHIKQIKFVSDVELTDVYENAYTFRIWYQDKNKTLNNDEVGDIRKNLISEVKSKFGVNIKE